MRNCVIEKEALKFNELERVSTGSRLDNATRELSVSVEYESALGICLLHFYDTNRYPYRLKMDLDHDRFKRNRLWSLCLCFVA